jgi:hypothetical protein
VCTASYQPASIAVADNYLSNYFDGRFFSGTMPSIPIAGVPFSAIIDMQNGKLMLADGDLQITPQTFLLYAQMLNED